MVRSIVIPHNVDDRPYLADLANLGEFQEAVGGWLEPIEVEGLDVTVYVNEALQRELTPVNARATALRWFFSNRPDRGHFMVGDVVLTARDHDDTVADLSEEVVFGLIYCHQFVVMVSSDGENWYETPACFGTVFEAALWALVMSMGSELSVTIRGIGPDEDQSDSTVQQGDRPWQEG
ncbi:DUF3846 domain-containing protein [Microbacterium sp. ASV81]|uniref:DUF3846 domain-containing protein n=1 Tax=Microbacterium capsulatum TaxID=3041921 RepID=A0ABU0XF53_9MICO|nr:DUF3846 domain-containing protein [Microbacterium sp. ASV81]MDQ4213732.1 DUF3846 domain-containing protein [Microbacterium sp. ASV81]